MHEAYAKSAVALCPPLEQYEQKTVPFPAPPLPAGEESGIISATPSARDNATELLPSIAQVANA